MISYMLHNELHERHDMNIYAFNSTLLQGVYEYYELNYKNGLFVIGA